MNAIIILYPAKYFNRIRTGYRVFDFPSWMRYNKIRK